MNNGRRILISLTLLLTVCLGLSMRASGVFAEKTDGLAANAHLLLKEASCLTVSKENGEIVLQQKLARNERFILRHRHSVHRSLVVEYLGAGPSGTIAILEGLFEDYGAGLPQKAEGGQELEFKGGKARLTLAPTNLPHIELRVGRVAEHTIILRDKEFALADLIEPGMVAILQINEKVCPHEYP